MPDFKNISEFGNIVVLDNGDFFVLWDTETGTTKRVLASVVFETLGGALTVNGQAQDPSRNVLINPDHMDDSATTKKFVTAAEKALIGLLQSGGSPDLYLDQAGNYSTPAQVQGTILSLEDPSPANDVTVIDCQNNDQIHMAINKDVGVTSLDVTLENFKNVSILDISLRKQDATTPFPITLTSSPADLFEFRQYDAAGILVGGVINLVGPAESWHTLSLKNTGMENAAQDKIVILVAVGLNAN